MPKLFTKITKFLDAVKGYDENLIEEDDENGTEKDDEDKDDKDDEED